MALTLRNKNLLMIVDRLIFCITLSYVVDDVASYSVQAARIAFNELRCPSIIWVNAIVRIRAIRAIRRRSDLFEIRTLQICFSDLLAFWVFSLNESLKKSVNWSCRSHLNNNFKKSASSIFLRDNFPLVWWLTDSKLWFDEIIRRRWRCLKSSHGNLNLFFLLIRNVSTLKLFKHELIKMRWQ